MVGLCAVISFLLNSSQLVLLGHHFDRSACMLVLDNIYGYPVASTDDSFLSPVTAADQQQAHELIYKMMLLLIAAAHGQLMPSGCRRCHYPILCCCCHLEIMNYVDFNHIFRSLVVPQINVTQKYPAPLTKRTSHGYGEYWLTFLSTEVLFNFF